MHLVAWVIDALEAGEYDRIGPAVYSQGHLRKYASILGVSTAQAAAQGAPGPQTQLGSSSPPTPIIRLDSPGGGSSIWSTVGGIAVIALVAGGIAWWRPWHGAGRTPATAGAPLEARVSGLESTSGEPAGAAATDTGIDRRAANEGAADGGDAAGNGRAAAAASAAAAARAGPVELTPGVGRARLRLSFSADSRVAVYDYTGKPVFTGNGRANSVKTLSGMAPFRVYLGFASGVQLEVNDRAVAIGPQFVSGDVARFEAGADGVLRRDPHAMPAGVPAPAAPRG
jgi:cytoskeleton protein RodZ